MCYFWKVNIITLNIQLSGPSSKVDYSITGWDICFGCQLSIHMLSGLTFRCTPAWLQTHNVFMFLPRTCVHSRLEVPRNYILPTNSLKPFAAAPQTSEWVLMRRWLPHLSVAMILRHMFDTDSQSSSADLCSSCQKGNLHDDAGFISFLPFSDWFLHFPIRAAWTQLCDKVFHLTLCVRIFFLGELKWTQKRPHD